VDASPNSSSPNKGAAAAWFGGAYLGANEDAAVVEAANAAQLEEGDLSDALGLSADVKGADEADKEGDTDMGSSDDRESSVTSEVSGCGDGGSGGETTHSDRSTSPDIASTCHSAASSSRGRAGGEKPQAAPEVAMAAIGISPYSRPRPDALLAALSAPALSALPATDIGTAEADAFLA